MPSSCRTCTVRPWRRAHGALSADHLEYLDADGIDAMAASGTVAVLLPGAFYHAARNQAAAGRSSAPAGVPIALATDCNPGTSPMTSMLLTMNMGGHAVPPDPRGRSARASPAMPPGRWG